MLNRLSIRYKIGLIALIGFIGFVVYQTASYRLSINLRDQMQHMIADDFVILQFTNEIQVNFTEMDKLYESALAEAEMDTLLEADAKATNIKLRFETLKARYDLDDPDFMQLVDAFNHYVDRASNQTAAVISGKVDYDTMVTGYREVDLLREHYHEIEKRFIEERYKRFEKQLNAVEQQETAFVKVGLGLGVLLSMMLLLFSVLIIRHLIAAFSNAVNVADQVAQGNLDQNIKTLAEDETGQLINSLIVMRDALKKQKEENIHREKVQAFLAGLNEVMRGDKVLDELARVILDYLVVELQAQVGVFYLLEGETLSMLANHAWPESSWTNRAFRLGETIVGQAGLEKRIKVVNDLPEDYVEVGSALGRATPRSLLLFPVLFEDHLKAVIEIGAFRRFDENDLILMQRCNDAIAVSINSAQSRNKVSSMLEQTRQQADELKRQRQELAMFNRQLEEKNFYLDSQRNEILEKNRELERSGKELVEKSQALEQSGKYKSQFLSTMSHELRTPLNSILILSEALMDNQEGHLDEREIQHARVINTAGADLLALINDILDLSKVEEGKMEIVIDEIDLHELAASFQQQFDYVAKDRGLQFQVNMDKDAPALFYTDRHRLKQIIKNFISNALKFTDKGGVFLDIGWPDPHFMAKHPEYQQDQILLFRVRDTGVGIDKSKQALIFEAFRQADGTTSRKYGGTGLGLSISLALARLLGGNIVLESEGEGKGSTFTLILPVVQPLPEEIASRHDESTVGGSSVLSFRPVPGKLPNDEILLLWNDDAVLKQLTRLSAQQHLSIHQESDLPSMMQFLHKFSYSAAVIDWGMLNETNAPRLVEIGRAVPLVYVYAPPAAEKQKILDMGVHCLDDKDEVSLLAMISSITDYQKANSGKVLVVEDNPVFQEVLRSVFTSHQLDVIIACDGSQALEHLSNTVFDCLIIDLNLPDYNGLDLLKEIRGDEHHKQQPVIVFTAEDLSNERQKELKRYASQILLKTPKVIIALYENVRRLIHEYKNKIARQNVKYFQAGCFKGKTFLLVDDDDRNIYSMSAMLEAEKANIFTAKSGREALDILNDVSNKVDMVLTDIMMPEMDGYEVLRRIRGDARLKDLPVLTITAKAMVGDREKCMEAGATDYLSKPIEKESLFECIAYHLGCSSDAPVID